MVQIGFLGGASEKAKVCCGIINEKYRILIFRKF
jgi:hypothetical protein